jgi:hypothetical protein
LATGILTALECSVQLNSTTIWRMNITSADKVFSSWFSKGPKAIIDARIGDEIQHVAPEKTSIAAADVVSHVIYGISGPALPNGFTFNEESGTLEGTALDATDGSLQFTISLTDMFSLLSKETQIVELNIAEPSSSPDFITAYGYFLIIPVVVAIIGYLIYWLYKRHDRRKLFHIFLSYRSIVVVCV